jgi:hypothetical protein
MARDNALFCKGDLYAALEHQKRQALNAIGEIPTAQFQAASNEELLAHLEDKYSIEPLTVYPDRAERSMREYQFETRDSFLYDIPQGSSIKVPGVAVTIRMPYTGEHQLFDLRPSMFTMNPPCAEVTQRGKDGIGWVAYEFGYNQHGLREETIRQEVESAIARTADTVRNQKGQIEQFERELRPALEQAIAQRRERLGGIHALAKALDIPVTQRAGMPVLAPIPVARKALRELPPVAKTGQSAGFSISEQAYANILSAVRAQGRTFEKSPATFARFDEEELRDVILANLNTHFQRQATGETFRARGKTDICIEQENRAAFVGECKVWRGPSELVSGLKQLLGYLTWRDCKAALIVFNKDRGRFSEVLEKSPEVLRQQKDLFLGESKQPEPGEWQITFQAPDDGGRHIIVQLMVYNLYVGK